MRDPRIHSSTWEWDYATPAALWKRSPTPAEPALRLLRPYGGAQCNESAS